MKNMKRLTILLAMFMVAIIPALAEDKKASVRFEETSHDFGTITEEGGRVSCAFPFVNEGDAPLVIISATAQCGCTKPSFPQKPVGPGEKGEIKVTYNPQGRPGEFVKEIKVKTNDKEHRTIRLKITGVVLPYRR